MTPEIKNGLHYEDLEVGQQLEPLLKDPVTKVQLVKYAGASGDFNPLHTDDEFARSIGMEGVIAHGMLIMGFLGEYVMELADQTAEVSQFKMRFGAMTRPGDQIKCLATVKDLYSKNERNYAELTLIAQKATGDVVGTGKALLKFR